MSESVIDFHVHLFPDRLFRAIWDWFEKHGWSVKYKINADEVVQRLKEQGIERFVLLNYSHKSGMSAALNAWTHEFCRKYPSIIPFGAIHPEEADVSGELRRCFTEYGFRGLKFHCHVAGTRPDDERMFPIYESLMEHDRLLMLHSGVGPSLKGYRETTKDVSGAIFTRNMLKRFPNLKVIVPHLGADEFEAFFGLMDEFPNLYLDTTMVVAGFFPFEIPWGLIERFSERILYGSDFPNIPYDMSSEIRAIRSSPLSETAQERILFRNAKKLLGLR